MRAKHNQVKPFTLLNRCCSGLLTIFILGALTLVSPLNSLATAYAAETSQLWKENIPDEIKNLTEAVTIFMQAYSKFKIAYDVTKTLLEVMGILDADDQSAQFAALHEHLDELGTKLDWKVTVDAQDHRLAELLATVETAGQAASLQMPFTLNTPGVQSSLQAVYEAEQPYQSLRYFVESATDGKSGWKGFIKDRPEHANGYVYDWRLSVPALMQLISLRLQIIAALDPDFRNDSAFDPELMTHRSALLRHYYTMIDGVRCVYANTYYPNPPYDVHLVCADYYTGLAATSDVTTDYFEAAIFAPIIENLHRQVLGAMPLFTMRSMIDTLFLYANPVPDLTEQSQHIALAAAPALCLEVQGGNPVAGTPIWLQACNGGDAQRWVYDRENGTIRHPVFDKCLDVQWGNSAPGTPVWLWDCNGGDAQQWTYDPETQVLQNGLGTVLDIQWGNLQAGTPV